MIGLGTIINSMAIVAGGIAGTLFSKFIKERYQETITKATGVSIIFLGAAGSLSKILTISNENILNTKGSMMMILSLVIGALIGEILDIDSALVKFGEFIKKRSGNAKDNTFTNAFVTASLTVCIGAMAIIGSIQDGLYGDISVLSAKAILDFVIILIMNSSLGKGCAFSAIPVFLFQGGVTALAFFISPFMTRTVLDNISLVGNILIFCVGLNLIYPKTVRVANLLPSIIIAVVWGTLLT